MPSFIVLAQLQHCFLEGGGIHPPPVIESQKKPGLNRVKRTILFRKRKQFSSVNLFLNTQKQNDKSKLSEQQSLHTKPYDLMLNGTFSN